MAGRTAQTDDAQSKRYLSPLEFSGLSGLSPVTVRRYLRNGKLPYRQPAGRRGRILIPADALEFLDADTLSQRLPQAPVPPHNLVNNSPPAIADRPPGPRPKWTRLAGPYPDKES
jgi:hypothetical protein